MCGPAAARSGGATGWTAAPTPPAACGRWPRHPQQTRRNGCRPRPVPAWISSLPDAGPIFATTPRPPARLRRRQSVGRFPLREVAPGNEAEPPRRAADPTSITRFCDHPQVCTRRWSQKWEVDAESGNAGSGGDAELVQGVFDDREAFHSGEARDGCVDLTGALSAFGSAHEVTHHVHDLGAVHDA